MRKRKLITWALVFIFWLVIGLSFSVNDYVFKEMLANYYAHSPSLRDMLFWDLVYWPTWAALTPLILLIARRFPLGRDNWHPNLIANLLTALSVPILQRIIYLLIAWPISITIGERISFRDLLLYNLPMGFVICAVVLLISHLKAELTKDELRVSRLQSELTQAQLQALKMQLQPHFLCNALNSIAALLRKDSQAAVEMLGQLGKFLSLTLENSDEQTVTLKEELDVLRCYLEIEKVMLRDRLQVRYEIEPEALPAQVPNLILQPIIENAIKHGVRQSFGEAQILVSAKRENGMLCLRIKDNGKNLPGEGEGYKERVGITNTRARLKSAYGSNHRFELVSAPDGWTTAVFEMPFVTTSESVARAV